MEKNRLNTGSTMVMPSPSTMGSLYMLADRGKHLDILATIFSVYLAPLTLFLSLLF